MYNPLFIAENIDEFIQEAGGLNKPDDALDEDIKLNLRQAVAKQKTLLD